MNTEQLIEGLEDIANGVIPVECIIDMAPEIMIKLEEYKRIKAFNEAIKDLAHAS